MAFFSRAPSSSQPTTPRRKAAAAGVFALAAGIFLLCTVARTATVDFTLTVGALLTLCGVLCYDIIGRRTWERALSGRVEGLARTADRLTREAARNRVDLASLRDSLAEAASAAARERTLSLSAPERTRDAAQDRTLRTMLEHLVVLRSAPSRDAISITPTTPSSSPSSPPPSWTPTQAANASVPVPSAAAPPRMPADGLSDAVVRELVRHTLREGSIDAFLQPVVALPQRRAKMHEMFGRIRARSDLYLPAGRYLDFVREDRAGAEMDTLVLLRVFERLRDSAGPAADLPVMINVSRPTLRDKGFMGDLILFLTNYHALARRMVFEMPMADLLAPDDVLEKVIGGLTRLGCRFSVDHVETLDLDPQALRLRGAAFVKIDAALILDEGARHGGIGRIVALRKALESEGVSLIATRVETERDLRELLDYAIPLAQGYLFAPPALPGARKTRPPGDGAEPRSSSSPTPPKPATSRIATGTPRRPAPPSARRRSL